MGRIRAYQKAAPEQKAAWEAFCNNLGDTTYTKNPTKDPNRLKVSALESFVRQYIVPGDQPLPTPPHCPEPSVPDPDDRRPAASERPGTPGGADTPASRTCTTMSILNIPYMYPRRALQRDIDQLGLPCTGLHYPPTKKKGGECGRGYAFADFATSEAAHTFQALFQHRALSHPGSSEKRVLVKPATTPTLPGQDRTDLPGQDPTGGPADR